MEFTRITEKNLEYFRPYIFGSMPDETQEAFGLIDEDGAPAAAAVLSGEDGEVSLDWIFVHPSLRRKGVASLLLRYLIMLLRDEADTISCSFLPEAEDFEAWLHANGFLVTDGEPLYRFPIPELLKNPEFVKISGIKIQPDIRNLSTLLSADRHALESFLEAQTVTPEILLRVDPVLSFVGFDKDRRVSACLLLETVSPGVHQVSLLVNTGSSLMMGALLRSVVQTCTEKNMTDGIVQFIAADERIRHFADGLLEGSPEGEKTQLCYAVIPLEM